MDRGQIHWKRDVRPVYLMNPLLYLRTARYHTARQLAAWLLHQVRRPDPRLPFVGLDVSTTKVTLLPQLDFHETHESRVTVARDLVQGRFRFMNRECVIPQIDWNASYGSSHWTYHLLCHQYMVDLACAFRETGEEQYRVRLTELYEAWISSVRRGVVRLDPYTISEASLNGFRVLIHMGRLLDPQLSRGIHSVIYSQLLWLEENLEVHLRANHLLKNLTALSWGSIIFSGVDALRWRSRLQQLWAEVDEQVLRDGGHFERSPMYHAAVLSDLLETLALCQAAAVHVPDSVLIHLTQMTRVLQLFTRRDGTIHLLNDAANNERPSPREVVYLARKILGKSFAPPRGHYALENTGYHGWIGHKGDDARLIIDAGPPGPSYLPAHAHCDMLSYELDLRGHPVVVDSGVHGYGGDPYREYVRSTRAHNTVGFAGKEQHELWATFRMARRGEILEAKSYTIKDVFHFRGSCRHFHDHRAVHHRSLQLEASELTVTDIVEGAIGMPVNGWLHLHPSFVVEQSGDAWIATAGDFRLRIEVHGVDIVKVWRGESDPVQGWYCPEFGLAHAAPVLEMRIVRNAGLPFGYRLHSV